MGNRVTGRGRPRRGRTLVAVGLGAVALAACFPAAAPPPPIQQASAPTTSHEITTSREPTAPPDAPTTAPRPAHLGVSPDHADYSPERVFAPRDERTFTVTNDGGTASGRIDFDGELDQPDDNRAHSDFELVDDHCTRRRLAPGERCTFTLALETRTFGSSAPWTGDLVVNASPGGPAHVVVTARYSSDLVFDQVNELVAGQTQPFDGVDHFLVTNDGPTAIGPLKWRFLTFGKAGAQGTFTHRPDATGGVDPCGDGITLAPGESCGWVVTYANSTGGGGNDASLIFDGPNLVHGEAAFRGTGLPTI